MKRILIAMLLVLLALGAAGCGTQQQGGHDKKFRIVTSFYPMYIDAINITKGVDGVEVVNMTKPQTGCLHDYQLTTEDMKTLEKADAFIVNGAGMESFLDKVIKQQKNLKVIDASKSDDINFLKDVTIDHIRGQHVELEVNGDIFAGEGRPEHIWANSLDMDVLGNIGTAKKPLLIHVPGKVVISTEYGSAYVRNLYQPETAEVAEKYGFGRIVSDADFRFVPYAFMTLRPVELHDSILTLKEVGGSRMVAIRGSGLDAVQGNVLYIWALDEDGVSVTNELRHLHLNAGTVRMMIALGYEWLMFQTGDSVVMIHLTELENGSYIITVDPQNADCTVSVSLDGEERNQLPDAMLVAEITDVPETV